MMTYLIQGGPLMIFIGLASILGGTFSIIAWLRIMEASKSTSKIIYELSRAIQKGDWAQTIQISSRHEHPFLKPWCAGLILLLEQKSSLKDVEEAISIEGAKFLSELESPLKPLNTIITILPMLGFLGTILGLILCFKTWEQYGAQVSISVLSGGIYQAMITTAAGLIAAIPYLIFHHSLHNQIEKIAAQFSHETTQLIRWIKNSVLNEIPLRTDTILSTTHDPIT